MQSYVVKYIPNQLTSLLYTSILSHKYHLIILASKNSNTQANLHLSEQPYKDIRIEEAFYISVHKHISTQEAYHHPSILTQRTLSQQIKVLWHKHTNTRSLYHTITLANWAKLVHPQAYPTYDYITSQTDDPFGLQLSSVYEAKPTTN